MRLQRVDFESSPGIRYNFSHQGGGGGGGGGVSTFFKSLYRTLMPLAKSAVKAINTTEAGEAIKTVVTDVGTKAAKDLLKGESVKSVVKKRLSAPVKSAKRTALDAGLDIINDTLKGKSLKKSAKNRISMASKKLLKEIVGENMNGMGSGGSSTKYGYECRLNVMVT